MQQKFYPGDVVKIYFGGVDMSVIECKTTEQSDFESPVILVLCEWQYDGKLYQQQFDQDNLELVRRKE